MQKVPLLMYLPLLFIVPIDFCEGFSVIVVPLLRPNVRGTSESVTTERWTTSLLELPACNATPGLWNRLVPKLWENPRGLDSSLQWTPDDAAELTTRRMMEDWVATSFSVEDKTMREQYAAELSASALAFIDAVQSQGPATSFKARVVASRGSAATKCPQWHIDHVPVRHIQSLVGPGCECADSHGVQWDKVNSLSDATDDLSLEERNQLLVGPSTRIHQAQERQAVLLIGNRWKEFAGYDLDPCVHRSPTGFHPWEGRVLLTFDILDQVV